MTTNQPDSEPTPPPGADSNQDSAPDSYAPPTAQPSPTDAGLQNAAAPEREQGMLATAPAADQSTLTANPRANTLLASAITGPLTIGDLLDRIFRVYRARFGVLVLTAAVLLVPIALFNGAVTGQFMVGYVDFLQTMVSAPSDDIGPFFQSFAAYALFIMLIALVGGLTGSLVNLAVSVHVLRFYQGEWFGVREGIRRALPRLWHAVLLYIIQGVTMLSITIAIALVVLVVFLLIGLAIGGVTFLALQEWDIAGPFAAVGVIVLFVCGYIFMLILLALPIVYLSARWIAAVPALIGENLGPIAALRRSWQLTKGNIWRSVFYIVLLFILSSIVITMPLAVIQQILLILPIPAAIAFTVSTALGSLFSVIWQPFYATGLVLLYFDLRVRRESLDLENRVTLLEQELGLESQE